MNWFVHATNVRKFYSSAACVLFWRKNDPSFYEMWLVILWKVTRRFVKNKPSFCGKQAVVLWKVEKWMRRHREEVKKKVGEMEILWERMGSENMVLRNVKWWVREASRARVHTHVNRSFCVFAVTSVTVIHVTDWNIVEYGVLLGFVCFWRVEIKKRGWKIDGDVEVRSSRFSQSFWGGVWHLWQQKN